MNARRLIARRSSVALAAGVLAAGMLLTGCGQMAESATEQLLEQAGGGSVNIDLEGENLTVEGEDGAMSMGGDLSLPDNWPSEVPTFSDGSMVFVTVDTAAGSASAMWNTELSVEDATGSIKGAVEGAGYAIESESQLEGLQAFSATGNGYRLDITVAGDGTATSVSLAATKQ
jgi:hypothetical protein